MKILLMRHGEAADDVEDRYGGWADYPLTNHGKEQIRLRVDEIKTLGLHIEIIYSSPLSRATNAAEILGQQLQSPVVIFEFLKERNYYGILSGLVKSEALQKYPEIVEVMKKEQYVIGSERLEDFNQRVRIGVEKLVSFNNDHVACVTHGNWLKSFFELFLQKKLTKREDGGWVLLDFDGLVWKIEQSSGLVWE